MDPFDKHLDDDAALARERELVTQTDNGPRPEDGPQPEAPTDDEMRTEL